MSTFIDNEFIIIFYKIIFFLANFLAQYPLDTYRLKAEDKAKVLPIGAHAQVPSPFRITVLYILYDPGLFIAMRNILHLSCILILLLTKRCFTLNSCVNLFFIC